MDEQETLAHIRQMAVMAKNSSPPKCHPITILILILSAGTIFIGMTMTITAHWPGSVSPGFDLLSIPGPILLFLGGVFFIIGSVLVCYFQTRARELKTKQFVSFANSLSKANLELSKQSQPLLEREPSQKNGRPELEDQTDPYKNRLPQRQEILDEIITTTYTTELTSSNPHNGDPDEDHLPLPVRHQTKKNKKNISKNKEQLENLEESVELPPLEVVKRSEKKKKKVNVNYSRDILESKRASDDTSEDHYQPHHRHHQCQHVPGELDFGPEAGEVDSEEGYGIRVQVKARPGTAVNIRHGGPNVAAPLLPPPHPPPLPPKKSKSKNTNIE